MVSARLALMLVVMPVAHTHTMMAARPALSLRAPSCQMANSWLEANKKRKEEERKVYEELAERAAQKQREGATIAAEKEAERKRVEAQREARRAALLDNQDFGRPGNVQRAPPGGVTRDMLLNSRKVTSPAIAADEAVKDALAAVGGLPPVEAVELLERVLAEARAAGTSKTSPNVKKAISLQSQLETAAGAAKKDQKTTDPQKASFDALFGDGYAMDLPDELDF